MAYERGDPDSELELRESMVRLAFQELEDYCQELGMTTPLYLGDDGSQSGWSSSSQNC